MFVCDILLEQHPSECQSRFQQWFPLNEGSSADTQLLPSAFRSKWLMWWPLSFHVSINVEQRALLSFTFAVALTTWQGWYLALSHLGSAKRSKSLALASGKKNSSICYSLESSKILNNLEIIWKWQLDQIHQIGACLLVYFFLFSASFSDL